MKHFNWKWIWLLQSNTEKVLILFGVTMLLFIVIVSITKIRHVRFITRHKVVYEGISVFIAGIYVILSFGVKDMIKPPLPYQLAMIGTALLINAVLVTGVRITSFFGIEMGDTAEIYVKLTDYAENADELTVMTTCFISDLSIYDKHVKRSCSEMYQIWLNSIKTFTDKKKVIKIREVDLSVSENFIKTLVFNKMLCYNEAEIKDIVKEIEDNKVVSLNPSIKLIPTQNSMIHIESEIELSDLDTGFMVNTYLTVMCLFDKEDDRS